MGAAHSAEGEGGAYASDPPAHSRRKTHNKRRRHSVDSVASYSSQNHVDRIRAQNFSAASCQDEGDFGSIKTCLFRRSSTNSECPHKRPESVTSNTSSTRSRLRELVERKSSQDDYKSAANTVAGDIQYFENPAETLEFDNSRNSLESKKSQEEKPKKRKLSKSKEKDKDKDKEACDTKSKKQEKYQSKLAEYYKIPVQLPQDEFYQHLTRSKAAEELLQKRFSNSDTEFNGSYGRLCKHKEPEGSNLRRSRSLAVIREETFTDLQIQNHAKSKRSQLIPRARLFDKPCFKDRLAGRAKYQTKEEVLEGIYIDSTASCFGDINGQKESTSENPQESTENRSEKDDILSRNESRNSRSVSGSWPTLNDELKQTNLSEDSIGHSRNPSEIDSLDSNYVRKHYNFEAHLKNHKDSSPETERSAISPENPCDNNNIENEETNRSIINTPKSYTNDSLSFSQSDKENKVLVHSSQKDDCYDEISLKSTRGEIKNECEEQTISKSLKSNDDGDIQSIGSENDGTVSSPPDSITSYISISIASSTDKSHKLEYLANSLAEKIDEYCETHFKDNNSIQSHCNYENNTESDPIYTKVNKKTFADIKRDSLLRKASNSSLFSDIPKKQNNEVYISNTYIECDNYSRTNNCASKNITTEPFVTTLIENQYYSLPDINISKCLRKSERIDAQLRKEDPEEISCENTYEVANDRYQDIEATKTNKNCYGQLNKTQEVDNYNIDEYIQSLQPQYLEPYSLQDFTKLEDDLKSIITIGSSNGDEKDLNYLGSDSHQNEREINEIEGTIRNNKFITKSESLKLETNSYQPTFKVPKSLSNDNLCNNNKNIQEKKSNTGIKKHYSLRQRDPAAGDINRLPSPNTVQRTISKSEPIKSSFCEEIKNHSLLSRIQSFKTTANSNIDIVPLSGHQTIVIDPPLTQNSEVGVNHSVDGSKDLQITGNTTNELLKFKPEDTKNNQTAIIENIKEAKEKNNTSGFIEDFGYITAKDPFITIKLNKVVKTTIPKLKTHTSENISCVQYKFEKPPSRLIIKEKNNKKIPVTTFTFTSTNMTRPQVLQVVDSKNRTQNTLENINKKDIDQTKTGVPVTKVTNLTSEANKEKLNLNLKEVTCDSKSDNCVKEKLNNAIKTDMEYQEKLHSVKNYWSKLIDKSPDAQDDNINVIHDNIEETKIESIVRKAEKEDDQSSLPDISVGKIIKSLESVKIVDSIRKLGCSKLQLWKDETEKVKSDSEIEEVTVQKVKDCENKVYEKSQFENNTKKCDVDLSRDTPEIEIVELTSDDNQNKKATLIKAKGFDKGNDEFDHVRYKVMKSELFKNSMIANYKKEAQFDGLLQYLQDYSFQELLVNNNIVIIEPVRTKIEPAPRKNHNTGTCKIPPTLLKKNENSRINDKSKTVIRRHFFYHPIRVNKEIIEEELPNPDTVKKVRNLFEDTLKMKSPMSQDPPLIVESIGLARRATSYRNLSEETKDSKSVGRKKVIRQLTIDTNFNNNKKWDNASLSSGVSSGDLSSNNDYETEGPYSHKALKDNVYSSSDEYLCDSVTHDFCCESQYVSPDILKKIRDCGTSVTYYGGKVLNAKPGSTVSPMTKAIMEEIKGLQKNCNRDCFSCQTKCRGDKCLCLVPDKHKKNAPIKHDSSTSSDSGNQDCEKTKRSESFPGFKFKLVKSNSCSSRLELTGTDECKGSRLKYRKSQSQMEDPPLLHDDENSVKNKISRLENYNKGIVNTPFESKNQDSVNTTLIKKDVTKLYDNKTKNIKSAIEENKLEAKKEETILIQRDQESSATDTSVDESEKQAANTFEKKYYYLNENLDKTKTTTGKFGEMVFEEFEVLESCYDSLNSNKSSK